MKAMHSFSILALFAALSIAAPAASPNSANKQPSNDYSNNPEPLVWIKREEQETAPLVWIKREEQKAEPLVWIKREEQEAAPLVWIKREDSDHVESVDWV